MITDIERIAASLTDGQRMIMRREANEPIRPSDWHGFGPTVSAYQKLHRDGLLSFFPGEGDPFWMIDETLGEQVRSFLASSTEKEG